MALFFRMVLRLFISLYTTRVILQALGTDNYAIYVLVSGFTVMFSFVNASMGTAISRFLSYSIGADESVKKLRSIFEASIMIQCLIACSVVLLGGIIGYVFITHFLNFPAGLENDAALLFACTLTGLVFMILQVPYNAVIIAYEKMTAYAYFEIVNSCLLLGIAFILKLGFPKPLVVYGLLLVLVYLVMFLTYALYCRQFAICQFKPRFNKEIMKPMLTFSGADLFSNSSLSLQAQGQNVIFNKFYNLSANAAIGIANQIYGAMLMFSSSITTAIRPQIIKYYAAKNYDKAIMLTEIGSKVLAMALISISVPIILRAKEILELWLGSYPQYTDVFVAIILIMNATFGYKGILVILVHATGKIGRFSIISGACYLAAVPAQYILATIGLSECVNYCMIIVLATINVIINIYFISKYTGLSFSSMLIRCGIPPIIGITLCLGISHPINNLFDSTIVHSLLFGLITFLINLSICWMVVLDCKSRATIVRLVKSGFSKIRGIK